MTPQYTEIMRELDIELIGREKSPKCHSNPITFQNRGLKVKKLQEVREALHYITFLRYHHGFWYISFSRNKVRTIPTSSKNGGYKG